MGSDHSDRALEAHSVTKAKNACPNVVARRAWPLDEVAAHFDRVQLSCDVTRGGETVAYQRGTAGELLPPSHWLEWLARQGVPGEAGTQAAFFSGTIPALHGLEPGDAYEIRMRDPVLQREIVHAYRVEVVTADGRSNGRR
ncbi:MAG: DUF2848 family protein [Limnochordaceae bacterium]|nr:DUF2848 family protein [Limnochordaceae bacterium]